MADEKFPVEKSDTEWRALLSAGPVPRAARTRHGTRAAPVR